MNKNRKPDYSFFPSWIWPVVLGLTVVSVWVRLGVVRSSYDVSQAEKTIRSLKLDREQIELRVAGLKSPRRLEMIARSQMGLSQPRPEQVIFMEERPSLEGTPASGVAKR